MSLRVEFMKNDLLVKRRKLRKSVGMILRDLASPTSLILSYEGQLSLFGNNINLFFKTNLLKKLAAPAEALAKAGVPDRIRTYDLQIRNLPLYPTELQAQYT